MVEGAALVPLGRCWGALHDVQDAWEDLVCSTTGVLLGKKSIREVLLYQARLCYSVT